METVTLHITRAELGSKFQSLSKTPQSLEVWGVGFHYN